MPLPLATIAIPVGTSIVNAILYLFRLSVIQWLTKAAIFSLVSIGAYFLAAAILPDWFSLQTLRDKIQSFSPAISYLLHTVSFYEGAPLMMGALIAAWVFKKVPGWVWLGPLYRLATKD